MSMTPLRENAALAIDGGGIKGLIVARALTALEDELGGGPLINNPQLKVLAGTSTGSIITAGLAMGMTASEISTMYMELGQEVFPPLLPPWFPDFIERANEYVRMLTQSSLYSNAKLIDLLKSVVRQKMGSEDVTLGDLHEHLGPEKTLILTAVDINERRTRFLKSYKDKNANWKLWEAILASSSAPIALPVWTHTEFDPDTKVEKLGYFTDGGAGNYGNPAYVAAQEAIIFRGYDPQTVSVLSFGTGWVNADNYQKANGNPEGWHALGWAMNIPMVLIGDAARAQSLEIIEGFGEHKVDLRRFQFVLENDINSDAFADDETYKLMAKLGDELGERVRHDQYAPTPHLTPDPLIDPEGLSENLLKYRKAKATAKASTTP